MRQSRVVMAWTWPHRVLTGAIAQVSKRFNQLKKRYGPKYAYAMVLVVFLALFSPVPGTALVAVGMVAAIAEIHRAIAKRGGRRDGIGKWLTSAADAYPKEIVMSTQCDVVVRWGATADQLMALGAALWRWSNRMPTYTGNYQRLDNQALADLIAGKLPVGAQRGPTGVHFVFSDPGSPNRASTIARLHNEIPAEGVEDILVDGTSWKLVQRPRLPTRT